MKKECVRSLILVGLTTMIISCSKKEVLAPETSDKSAASATTQVEEYAFFPAYQTREPGQDATGSLNYPTKPSLNFPYGPDDVELPRYPFKVIESPIASYLKETCLFDVSKLENNKSYHKLQNGSLRIGFFEGNSYLDEIRGIKLKSSSANGWNSHWGFSPTVENENPDVFFFHIYNFYSIYIYLSKPCIEFGFEIAPNHKNANHNFFVYYGDYTNDDSKGSVTVNTKSPSGARLYAVKATKPFRMVTILSSESPTAAPVAEGLAIANIRYKLAK